MTYLIDLKNVKVSYPQEGGGRRTILDGINLQVRQGEFLTLVGPSGCGKSTFLRILNRMHELVPSASLAGEVLLDGVDIYDPARRLTDARRQVYRLLADDEEPTAGEPDAEG